MRDHPGVTVRYCKTAKKTARLPRMGKNGRTVEEVVMWRR